MSTIGKVKWFDTLRGYGFIEAEGTSDVFVHFTALNKRGYRSLYDGQKVSFDLVQGIKGPQAENVSILQ